jgi:hypothetical protein
VNLGIEKASRLRLVFFIAAKSKWRMANGKWLNAEG